MSNNFSAAARFLNAYHCGGKQLISEEAVELAVQIAGVAPPPPVVDLGELAIAQKQAADANRALLAADKARIVAEDKLAKLRAALDAAGITIKAAE